MGLCSGERRVPDWGEGLQKDVRPPRDAGRGDGAGWLLRQGVRRRWRRRVLLQTWSLSPRALLMQHLPEKKDRGVSVRKTINTSKSVPKNDIRWQ